MILKESTIQSMREEDRVRILIFFFFFVSTITLSENGVLYIKSPERLNEFQKVQVIPMQLFLRQHMRFF